MFPDSIFTEKAMKVTRSLRECFLAEWCSTIPKQKFDANLEIP